MKTLTHAYKFYKEKYKDQPEYKLTASEYKALCYDYNKRASAKVLEGEIVFVPYSLGQVYIKRRETNYARPGIDWVESKKAGVRIYHMNFHSDGWRCRWHWSKRNNLITNLIYYSFKPSRANDRLLAAIMKVKDGYKRYFL